MKTYLTGRRAAFSEGNWSDDDHYAIIVTEGYEFDADHDTVADVVAFECGDADYDPQDLTGETDDISGDYVVYDCDDIDFGNPSAGDPVTLTGAAIIIVMGTAGAKDNADVIVGWHPFIEATATTGVDVVVDNSPFKVKTTNGIARLYEA